MTRGVVTLPELDAADSEAVFQDSSALSGELTLDGNLVSTAWVGPVSGNAFQVRVTYAHRGKARRLTIEGFALDSNGAPVKKVEVINLIDTPSGTSNIDGKALFYGITKLTLDGPLLNGEFSGIYGIASIGIHALNGPSQHVLMFTSAFTGGKQQLSVSSGTGSVPAAIFDANRRVEITSSGDISGVSFTITGLARDGQVIQEIISGPNATSVVTNSDFDQVLLVLLSGTTGANTFTIGTNEQASSEWIRINNLATPTNVAVAAVLSSGAVLNYTVEHTFDSNISPTNTGIVTFNHDNTDLVNASTNQNSNYAFTPIATRVKYDSYASGSLEYTANQSGVL